MPRFQSCRTALKSFNPNPAIQAGFYWQTGGTKKCNTCVGAVKRPMAIRRPGFPAAVKYVETLLNWLRINIRASFV